MSVKDLKMKTHSLLDYFNLYPFPIMSGRYNYGFHRGTAKSGRKSTILVVVDKLSKFAHFIPLAHPFAAQTVAQHFIEQVYKLHGIPRTSISNRDSLFRY